MTTEVLPIKRIVVDGHLPYSVSSGVLVRWVMNDKFPTRKYPLKHIVMVSDAPSGVMTTLGEGINIDEFLDGTRRDLTKHQNVWYAIKTIDKEGEVYYTPPQKLGCVWRKREWLLAREATRQSAIRLVKRRAGVRGFFLRRRTSGNLCECVDPDTGQVTDPDCPKCYGTKYEGGYHEPIECYVDQHPEKVMLKLDATQGMLSDKVAVWNVSAFPLFHPNDFWVDANSNKRYRIQENVAVIAHLEGVPLFLQVQVKLEDMGSPIYTFPVDKV